MDTLEAPYYTTLLTKRTVSHHMAAVIIESERKGKFLLEVHDAGRANYLKGYATLIGGTHNADDLSPEEILQRTFRERFSEGFQKALHGRIYPYKDWYVDQISHKYVCSVFLAQFPQDDFEQIHSMIRSDSTLSNEARLEIYALDNLLSNNYLPDTLTDLILGEYAGVTLPNSNTVLIESLGRPRLFLEAYTRDFVYQNPVRISTG